MTLLFYDGYQDCTQMIRPEWAAGSPTWLNATGRDSSANGGALLSQTNARKYAPISAATAIGAVACSLATSAFGYTGANHSILCMGTGTTTQIVLVVNSSGMVEVRRTNPSGTLLGTSSGHAPITPDTWHHYAMKATMHSSSGGIVQVRLDNVLVINLSGVTTSSVTGNVELVGMGSGSNQSHMTWDDFYVCDAVDATATQGKPNNDFLGDLSVKTVIPTADGDSDQWTPSTGTNNAAVVDESPPNTTDYVSTSTVGHRDLYVTSDLPANAIEVYGVRVGVYAQKSDAGAASIKTAIKENSTVSVGSTQALLTSWSGFWGAARYLRPSDSADWSVSDVNGMQIGVEAA